MKRRRSPIKVGPERLFYGIIISIATFYSVKELVLEFMGQK
jgi:hypothetical protein